MDDGNKIREDKKDFTLRKKAIKTLLLKRINIYSKENQNILDLINKSFKEPQSFFSSSIDGKRIIIGKKIPKFKDDPINLNDEKDNTINKQYVRGFKKILSTNNKKRNFHSLNKYNDNPTIVDNANINLTKEKDDNSSNIYKRTLKNAAKSPAIPLIERTPISDTELNDIYENFKQLEKKNNMFDNKLNSIKTSFKSNNFKNSKKNYSLQNSKRNSPNLSFNYLKQKKKKSLNNILKLQEKTLKLNKKHLKEKEKIEKLLSKNTKKQKENLLINQTSFYRTLKELRNKNEFEEGNNYYNGTLKWLMHLRVNDEISRNKNKIYIRDAFINIGCLNRPKFAMIYSKINKPKEKIRSYFNKNFTLRLSKSQSLIKNKLQEAFEELDDLSIQGKNLLNCEMENASLIKGKKIIYKKILRVDENNEQDYVKSYSVKGSFKNQIIDNCGKLHYDFEKIDYT